MKEVERKRVRGEGRSSSDKEVEEVEWTRRREVGKDEIGE